MTQEGVKIKYIPNHIQHGKGVKEVLTLKPSGVSPNVEEMANPPYTTPKDKKI